MNKFILSIIGKSGSGKTTLLKKLIPELVKRGYKVGTIKHTHHHDFEIDKPGKDSWEHQNAGATSVAISSTNKFAFIKKLDEELTVKDIVSNCFSDVDLVLAEGFKKEDFPKIEVLRKDIENVREVNKKLEDEINELHRRELQICQETASLKAKVDNLEDEIILKLENRYLKDILKRLPEFKE